MVFDFTKLMEEAGKNKNKSYEEQMTVASEVKPSRTAHPVHNGRGSSRASSSVTDAPKSKPKDQHVSKRLSSNDVKTKRPSSSGYSAKGSSAVASDSKHVAKVHSSSHSTSSKPIKSSSKIDPAKVADYLRKKQMQEQEEERRRLEEKRRVMEFRAMQEKQKPVMRKTETGAASAANRPKLPVEKQPSSPSVNSVKPERSRHLPPAPAQKKPIADARPSVSDKKTRCSVGDEPNAKRRKLDHSDPVGHGSNKEGPKTSKPSSSADFSKLMKRAEHNQHGVNGRGDSQRIIDHKKHPPNPAAAGHKLPSIPLKRDSSISHVSSSDRKRSSHGSDHLQRKPAQNSSHSSTLENRPGQKTVLSSKSASIPALQKSKLPSKDLSSARPGSSSQIVQKVPPSKHVTSNSSHSKPSSSKPSTPAVQSRKCVTGDPKTVSGSNERKALPASAGNSKANSGPTKTPLLMKSAAAAAAKTAMMTAKPTNQPTSNGVKPPMKSAKLISAPIFDAPRDQKPTPHQKNSMNTPPAKKPDVLPVKKPMPARPLYPQPMPTRPIYPQPQPSTSKRPAAMSQAELFNRKIKLKQEEERARMLALKKLSKNPNWEEDDDEDDEDEEEYDSEMDDFIDDGPVDGEQDDYSEHIKSIFGYDKKRYRLMEDDDDPNMESDYRQIQKEEAASARAGLKEDLEDFLREQRMEAAKKKRRM